MNVTRDGFINVHPSMLPKYRGGNPYSRVIMNGETETGVTIHFMDEGFDTGDIIAQKAYHIHSKATMGTIFNELNVLGIELLLQVLQAYENEELSRIPQPREILSLVKVLLMVKFSLIIIARLKKLSVLSVHLIRLF